MAWSNETTETSTLGSNLVTFIVTNRGSLEQHQICDLLGLWIYMVESRCHSAIALTSDAIREIIYVARSIYILSERRGCIQSSVTIANLTEREKRIQKGRRDARQIKGRWEDRADFLCSFFLFCSSLERWVLESVRIYIRLYTKSE